MSHFSLLVKPIWQPWLFWGGLTLLLALGISLTLWQLPMAEPYVRSVMVLSGNIDQGEQIFLLNCASCHGVAGIGQVGPSLVNVASRRSQAGIIHQITSGRTPPMPKFQATPQEMADLLSYLNTL
ncbi:cytochrome c [Synechococcus sp. PCC 6312]|uniref:c-type cytochrome n=1 Tax=Synechococcus sp. (strain ATCC 27167 / PCC 6312) TaxID=195253 RepID=UPI00029ED64F|nr:cytochrome c [Synechococcus sp. PCC 6312]AFY59993.1 cytochrome c, mono- and diheme variants family [Synechococcus sp. PCC 6312]